MNRENPIAPSPFLRTSQCLGKNAQPRRIPLAFRCSPKVRLLALVFALLGPMPASRADDIVPTPAATQPAGPSTTTTPPADASQPTKEDLRSLIGVNPVGLKRIELPRLPAMSLRGYIRPEGKEPMALLEIAELNRVFLVQKGTEIPVMVQGRLSPLGRNELTGLAGSGGTSGASGRTDSANEESQIILEVLKVTNEGVTVKAGLLAQTIIIR